MDFLSPLIGGVASGLAGGLFGGGGDDGEREQTVTNEPWSGLKPYLEQLYKYTGNLMGSPMSYYPYNTVAQRSPMTEAGQAGLTQYATNALPNLFAGGYGAMGSMLNAPDVASNPYVNRMLETQAGQVSDQLNRSWLPSIRTGAQQAGQYGGSRQGIAEGLAIGEAAKALNQGAAQTQLGAYGQGLDQQARGMQQLQALAQLGMMPAQTYGAVGGMQEGYNQQQIDASKARHDYQQMEPWQRAIMSAQILNGAPSYGTQTTTGPGSSGMANMLGTGLSVYGLGNQMGWWSGLSDMFRPPAPVSTSYPTNYGSNYY